METQEEMSRYFWSESTNCTPVMATCKTWNGESRNGMGNGMEWNGMEWNGMGNGMTRNCKSRNL